jgi:hypothetical protein
MVYAALLANRLKSHGGVSKVDGSHGYRLALVPNSGVVRARPGCGTGEVTYTGSLFDESLRPPG